MRGRCGTRLAAAVLAVGCAVPTAACSSGHPAAAEGSTGSSRTSAATSAARSSGAGGGYLALGDSVPFGFHLGGDFQHPASLVGYPSLVARHRGLALVDATCPGETTASFLDASAPSNGCERTPTSSTGYRTAYPLHAAYDSPGQSQLAFALGALRTHPDVALVTLQIGANDAFLCQSTTPDHCAALPEQLALGQQVSADITKILTALRDDGGYHGKVVVVTYYALDYSGPAADGTRALDGVIASAATGAGAVVADGFAAFQPKATAAGGSAVTAGLVFSGDVHPTAGGQALLAGAVEAVLR